MSRLLTLTVLVWLFLAVSGQISFPLCSSVRVSFGNSEINLFFNGQGVQNVLSTECLVEKANGELQ